MKWPWQRGPEPVKPITAPPPAANDGDVPNEDLRKARNAAKAAQDAYLRAHARRAAVVATGRALEITHTRNHLAELVRGALGSGQ